MDGESMAPRGFTQVTGLMYSKELLALSPLSLLQQQLHDRTYFILLEHSPETLCQAQKDQQRLRVPISE